MNEKPLDIKVPPSKSLTQRALIAASLAPGTSRVIDPLRCDDSDRMIEALRALGKKVEENTDGSLDVHGGPKVHVPDGPLMLGNAGTAMRFLTPMVLLADGPLTLDGVSAMRKRPMTGLLDALSQLGVQWQSHGLHGCPPVTLMRKNPKKAPVALRVALDPTISSQQLSALLMIGPALGAPLEVRLTKPLPSEPYVRLTFQVMEAFGITVEHSGEDIYRTPAGPYRPSAFTVEGDHSSASYVWAAAALTGRPARIVNIDEHSRQGDRVFPELLNKIMSPEPAELDLSETPDIAPTAAVCALFGSGQTRITNVPHLRHKECDRLTVLYRGLSQIGADMELHPDGWTIRPGPLAGPASLDPDHDHRMAMCFGLLSLKVPGIEILNPECVSKSYPGYWEMLEAFR